MSRWFIILLTLAMISACGQKDTVHEKDVFYTCSMDPQVVSDKPGNCPICGMPLTPVKKSALANKEDIELSDRQIQLGNIKSDTARESDIGNSIELTGTLSVNASQTSSLSARVMGRIERLYVKAVGDYVAKGAPVYEIYSEELNNAKQEYISALKRRELFNEQSVIDFDELIRSGKNKLRLWGMSENQIKSLELQGRAPVTTTFYSTESGYVTSVDVAEGGYVMEGGTVLQLADLSTLWVEAQDLMSPVRGKIEFSNPEVSNDTRINFLRIVVPNPAGRLRPGMSALVNIQTANRKSLVLPTDAVIREANASIVWLKTGDNTFKSRMVSTGVENNGLIEITSGIKPGDIVVTSGTYLLHSEYIFKRGADPMAGHDH